MPPTALELEPSSTSRATSGYDEWMSVTPDSPASDYARLSPFDLTIYNELDRLTALKPNWDGEGANRVKPEIIEAARDLISALPRSIKAKVKVPAVVPMRKGNLQFEWHDGPKTLELEIETPGTIHYLKWHSEAGIEEEEVRLIADTETVTGLIEWFVEG
jgi:hypothetical protein